MKWLSTNATGTKEVIDVRNTDATGATQTAQEQSVILLLDSDSAHLVGFALVP